MNIMIYNREKSLKSITKEGQRSIRLGNMSVTTALVYEMQLTDGDTVSLANDEDDPKKWYLCKAADGFPVRIDRVPRRNNKPRSEGEVCYGAKFNSRWEKNSGLGGSGRARYLYDLSQDDRTGRQCVLQNHYSKSDNKREPRLYQKPQNGRS